ncbi:DUF2513 domain-containing protein [Paraclostridium sordellii]|nr:DUF2513 domain-containing protein [Paeniclostridium sordellii]CEQ14820.1 Hypothetical protein (DUF2513) [[Clostridium] sordellii] [Paeniclostridium sordellii]
MRLNPDCVRDILLTVEENTGFNLDMSYPSENIFPRLISYSPEEVLYHIKQCEASYLITKVHWFLGGSCLISDLTPDGHKFLADIRSDTNWSKTKEISKNIGTSSLDAIKQIATGVITELIKSQF